MTRPAPIHSPESLVFISAAEPSADLHGASLIRAVRRIQPEVRFAGVAGPAMRGEGCWTLYDMCHRSAMLTAAFGAIGAARRMWATARAHLARYPFQAAILIDSPALHLPLAKRAKKLGVPVFYYIAPQVWAWGAYRIPRIRRRVDRMGVILPFEQEYFRQRGIDATFVGHPLFEVLLDRQVDQERVGQIRGRGSPVITLLPGSRQHVVEEVLPGQILVAASIARRYPNAAFCVSAANPTARRVIEPLLARAGLPVELHEGENGEILSAADLVLAASGTATLEVAFYHKPMIIMYKGSRWGYHLVGRWLIRTRHLSLVNILAGREIVPEFMPYYTSAAPIAEQALRILATPELSTRMEVDLADMVGPLLKPDASANAARLLLDLIDQNPRSSEPTN